MRDEWWPWILRAIWLSLPFTLGQVIGDAVADNSRPVQLTVTVGCWLLWSLGTLCTLIPHAATLTAIRMIAPATVVAAIWASFEGDVTALAVVSIALSTLAALVALTPPLGAWFVNGSSYGNESRVPLRPPGALLAGPIPLAWAAVVALAAGASLLLAAQSWIAGAILAVVAVPATVVTTRSFYRLARRWLVFVPAGMVVHDHMTVPEPILFKRNAITSFGPALVGSTAIDLTMGALGLVLEVRIHQEVEIAYRTGPVADVETARTDAVLVAPSRPGDVLEAARERRIAVG